LFIITQALDTGANVVVVVVVLLVLVVVVVLEVEVVVVVQGVASLISAFIKTIVFSQRQSPIIILCPTDVNDPPVGIPLQFRPDQDAGRAVDTAVI
jgi:hypothetical protein